MATPIGPVFTGAFEEITAQGYRILFLPDRNNPDLRAAGEPMHFYWVPSAVKLAFDPEKQVYKFHQIHFVEELEKGKVDQVVGGALAFSTTSDYPANVLQEAERQLLEKCRKRPSDPYWYYDAKQTPAFSIVPITSNTTAITNLSPDDPTVQAGRFPNALLTQSTGLDKWAWRMQGQGNGSVTGGENAYSGLVGDIPSQILWDAFHGSYSVIAVSQNLLIPMWSQYVHLKMTGEWKKIYDHLSTAASGNLYWFDFTIKAELNRMIAEGVIKVSLSIDGTTPSGKELEKAIEQRIDLILNQFMDQATQMIFTPAPQVEAADTEKNLVEKVLDGAAASFELKARRDITELSLEYEEERFFKYNQPTLVSSVLEGFFEEISEDPEREKKYFSKLVLGTLNKQVARIVEPIANWQEMPIAFMQTQVSYPDKDGVMYPKTVVFKADDHAQAQLYFPYLAKNEVKYPPPGWEPDRTLVKRVIEFKESEEGPFSKVIVEKKRVELDPDDVFLRDIMLTVRAEQVGMLNIGPISLWEDLDKNTLVQVEFKPLGKTWDGHERPIYKFLWKQDNQLKERFLKIYTGEKQYRPDYLYRVTVNIKQSGSTKVIAGPWTDGPGNGDFVITLPSEGNFLTRVYSTDLSVWQEMADEYEQSLLTHQM